MDVVFNMKKDYKKLSDKELIEKIKEFNFSLQKSFYNLAPKNKHFQRNLKKEIAKIKTEQSRRKNDYKRKN